MKFCIKEILVPTDFSDASDNALRLATAIAARHNANIHLLHITETNVISASSDPMFVSMPPFFDFLEEAQIRLKVQKEIAENYNHNITVYPVMLQKGYNEAIADYCSSAGISMVITGTANEDADTAGKAYSIMKHVQCPVMTVPVTFDKSEFHGVLFPVRSVEGVFAKYDYVLPFLDINRAILHVLGITGTGDNTDAGDIRRKVDGIIGRAYKEGREVSYEVVQEENIADAILKTANERMDELIIINATADKKWYEFFKSGFTEKIVRNAGIPVLALGPQLTHTA